MTKSKLNDLMLTFFVLFIGSKANIISTSDTFLIISFAFSGMIFLKRGIKIPKSFKIFTLIYLLLTLLYFLKFGWINITSSIRVYLKILVGVMVLLTVKEKLFVYLEKFIVRLALISIPLYLFQLLNYDLLKSIIGILENNISYLDYRDDWYVNNLFFTLNDNAQFRNSGFAWEPKGFANFLSIGIIINLLRNNFKFNKSLFIMYLATVSTFSTVGYIIVFVLTPLFIYQQKNKLSTFSYVFIFLLVAPIFTLDFMTDKIINEASTRDDNLKYIYAKTNQETKSLGRFGSLQLALKDFPSNPIIGIGMQDKERTQGRFTRLVWVNGIADVLSRFGIVGIIFLFLTYKKSIKKLLESYNVYKGKYVIFVIFISIFFASAVIIQPMFFIFQFFYLIKNNEKDYSYSNTS